MSFFIRNKSKNYSNLTQSLGGGEGRKQRNTEVKKRPINRKKPLGGKRNKSSFGGGKEPDKRQRFNNVEDEEIESSESEEEALTTKGRQGEDGSEEEYHHHHEDEDGDETAQDKKLRLAKLYLEEIAKQEKRRREDQEVDKDLIASRLKEDVLETEGRLKREVADLIEPDLDNVSILTCSKYLKRSTTCLCITEDDKWIFSGSKDGHLFKWDVQEKKKIGMVKRRQTLSKKQKKKGKKLSPETENSNASHSSTITAIAVSSDAKFLASGDEDGKIVIWNPDTLVRIHVFTGHRGTIRGLTFRKKKHTLYSCSEDRSVRIWDLDAMGYVESLFGHQDAVTCIDALTRERVVTGGGRDNTVRVWKIVEESQLVYNGHYNGCIDSIKLVNEENFVSCGDDGLLCTWNVNRKKPLCVVEKAHGTFKSFPESEFDTPRWVTALAAWTNTDLVVSGSSDGFLRFWKCGERFKSLDEVFRVVVQGWVNTMEFSGGSECSEDALNKRPKFLAVGTGKEHRLGRWFQDFKENKNGIVIIPLKYRNSKQADSLNDSINRIYQMTDDDSS